ncbi:MAG: gamma-glutamylcyclotransferase [Dongiaceae bacterium]
MAEEKPVPPAAGSLSVIRKDLQDGTLLARVRAHVSKFTAGQARSDEEIDASLDGMLARHEPATDVWLFGYGSLMWNPIIEYEETRTGLLRGWHRRFCLWLPLARGTPDYPGLTLALDRGGICQGKLFRIPAEKARAELLLVWRREMWAGAYGAEWMEIETDKGPVRAIALIVNPAHPAYAGKLDQAEVVTRLATATGTHGSCAAYLEETVGELHALGLADPELEQLWQMVRGL